MVHFASKLIVHSHYTIYIMFQLIYAKDRSEKSIELERHKWANERERSMNHCMFVCVRFRAYLSVRTSERMSKYKYLSKQQIARKRIVIIIGDNRELAMTETTLDLSYMAHTLMWVWKREEKTKHNSIIILCVRVFSAIFVWMIGIIWFFISVSRFHEFHLRMNLSFASCGSNLLPVFVLKFHAFLAVFKR